MKGEKASSSKWTRFKTDIFDYIHLSQQTHHWKMIGKHFKALDMKNSAELQKIFVERYLRE